jgi:hypothetical protein
LRSQRHPQRTETERTDPFDVWLRQLRAVTCKRQPAFKMSNDTSAEQMQARITAARREAEGLKDRIKRKKDDLADASRKCYIS